MAKLLPIPRRYTARRVERYGFHGLAYPYLLGELGRGDSAATRGRMILVHLVYLGSGASLAAVRAGPSIDTSMGFTPAAVLATGTRSGDLDPGLPAHLVRAEKMTPARFNRMVNHESGLLGVSGTSADMCVRLAREQADPRAAEAIALFYSQAKKWIGAYAAPLGGLDTLFLAGGIGENAPLIWRQICRGLEYLGITLGAPRDRLNSALVFAAAGHLSIRVIRTKEEGMLARAVCRFWPVGAAAWKENLPHQPIRKDVRPTNQETT